MKNPSPWRIDNRSNRSASSEWWANHFRRDLQLDWTVPWDHEAALLLAERERIAASIAEFQRGESSEARVYLGKSERFGEHVHDPVFHEVSRLFVRSENAHADLLLRFMRQTGIPVQKSSSRDGIFRWLRSLSDLGWTSRVILIAEIVAQEYYPCLRAATKHPALNRICTRIISEEAAHIRFQVERIVRIESALRTAWIPLRDGIQFVLMGCTALVVYAGHHRVLSTRLSFGKFLRRVLTRLHRAVVAMRSLRVRKMEKTPEVEIGLNASR